MSTEAHESTGETVSNIWDLLPDEWETIVEKKLQLIEDNQPQELRLRAEEITNQEIYLNKWLPGPTKEELEDQYSDSAIKAKEAILKKQEEEWKSAKKEKEKALNDKKIEVNNQKTTVQQKEKVLKDLLEEMNALPTELAQAKKKVSDLEKELEEAQGPLQKELIERKLKAAKFDLDDLSSRNELLEEAIGEAYDAWLNASKTLRELAVGDGGQEDIEIAIKKLDARADNLSKHKYTLVEALFKLLSPAPTSQE